MTDAELVLMLREAIISIEAASGEFAANDGERAQFDREVAAVEEAIRRIKGGSDEWEGV